MNGVTSAEHHEVRERAKLEALGVLATGIAHEINTPTQYVEDNLRFIAEGVQDLLSATLEGDGTPEAQVRALAADLSDACMDAVDGIARIARIVGAMRNLAHPGQQDLSRVQARAMVDDALTITRSQWKHTLDVEVGVDEGLELYCEPQAITQCLVNLLVNAAQALRDAGPERGCVRMLGERQDDQALLVVEDDGPGVPVALRGKIFEPFFTTKCVGDGTGQGLALVRQIVEQRHGGRIVLDESAAGGARFSMLLPLSPSRMVVDR